MASLKEISEGPAGTVGIFGFRIVVTLLLGLLSFMGKQVWDKVSVSADRSEVIKTASELKEKQDTANTKLWAAISTATSAQNALAQALAVLQTQFVSHVLDDKAIENRESDHESRIRQLEASKHSFQ